MALRVTENLPKLLYIPEIFFMKMTFHRRRYTVVVNIIAQLKLKIGRSMLFSALLMKGTLSVIVVS